MQKTTILKRYYSIHYIPKLSNLKSESPFLIPPIVMFRIRHQTGAGDLPHPTPPLSDGAQDVREFSVSRR